MISVGYEKSQVHLQEGADQVHHGNYINSCYVNNFLTFDDSERQYGNKKIIAS